MKTIRDSYEWGMLPPRKPYVKHTPTSIVVHHSGIGVTPVIPTWIKNKVGINILRSIEINHRDNRNWSTIGYHYMILPDGEIYIGRPDDVVGAHVAKKNTGRIGIMVHGNFKHEDPTEEQVESLKWLLEYLTIEKYKISLNNIFGHRDLVPSACPGASLYAILQDIKKAGFVVLKNNITETDALRSKEVTLKVDALKKEIANLKESLSKFESVLTNIVK